MVTLKKAREAGRLDEFIAEREAEGQPAGDKRTFDETVKAMAEKSSEAPAASPKGSADD